MKYSLITQANAQEVDQKVEAGQFSFTSFIPLILIFAVFYFLIIRPQSKKIKEQQALIDNLKIGANVVTSSGIIGIVKSINEKENLIELEIAEKVNIKILRNSILDLVKK